MKGVTKHRTAHLTQSVTAPFPFPTAIYPFPPSPGLSCGFTDSAFPFLPLPQLCVPAMQTHVALHLLLSTVLPAALPCNAGRVGLDYDAVVSIGCHPPGCWKHHSPLPVHRSSVPHV